MEAAVIGLAVILALNVLGAVVLLILSYRKPRPYEPAVPDFVPDDWPTGGVDVLPTYHVDPEDAPPLGGLPPAGGDRAHTRPDRTAPIKRGTTTGGAT